MAFEDLLGSDRSMEWISAGILAGQGFGGTTGKMTVGVNNNASIILWNPANSGVKVYLYGMQVVQSTGGIYLSVANITADPGFTAVAGLNKARGNAAAAQAIMEFNANDSTAAPAAANTTDTIDAGSNGLWLYVGYTADTLLLPGNGIRVYYPGASGQFLSVNFDWLELVN
jgi:hypothetical protein